MHHFFTEPSQIRETEIFIEGADFNHMKNVLRMKPGEKVGISDGQGTDYTCEVERFEEGAAVLHILSSEKSYSEAFLPHYSFSGTSQRRQDGADHPEGCRTGRLGGGTCVYKASRSKIG